MSGTRGDICIKTTCIAQYHQPGLSVCLYVLKNTESSDELIDVVHTQYSLKNNNNRYGLPQSGSYMCMKFHGHHLAICHVGSDVGL